MGLGDDAFDRLAHDLTETDFDAVERDGLRAEWTDEGETVTVREPGTDDVAVYNAEDLVRAASDVEVRNARDPHETSVED